MESALPSPAAAQADRSRPRAIANLLLFVAALVFAMVVVGGITRLTESGLSITEWKPITGAIPPLTHADWGARSTSTSRPRNIARSTAPAGMTLAGFKYIFFGNGCTACSAG